MKKLNISFMLRTDIPYVLKMELAKDEIGYNHDGIEHFIKDKKHVIMVSKFGNDVIGLLRYRVHTVSITIHDILIDVNYRRLRVATKMLNEIKQKLINGREKINAHVPECNLLMQLCLRYNKFICKCIEEPNIDGDENEPTYLFQYTKGD